MRQTEAVKLRKNAISLPPAPPPQVGEGLQDPMPPLCP